MTAMKAWNYVIGGLVGIIIGILIAVMVDLRYERVRGGVEPQQTDTLIIHDTLQLIDTILQKHVVKHTVRDTIHIPDTLIIRDTLFTGIAVVREQVTYTDSSTYRAVISGVKPSLDSLELWKTSQIITVESKAKPSRWGIGVTAGVGWSGGSIKPTITAGVTYNITQF